MSTQNKLLTLMLAAVVGTMVVGCQRQEGTAGDGIRSSSTPMGKQGTATAPGDSNSTVAGAKEGSTGSSREGQGQMGAAPPPMTGEKSDPSTGPSAGSKPPGTEEGAPKPKGSS